MAALRRAYQRALLVPTPQLEALWRAYEGFEMAGSNKQLARRLLDDARPKYQAGGCARDGLLWSLTAFFKRWRECWCATFGGLVACSGCLFPLQQALPALTCACLLACPPTSAFVFPLQPGACCVSERGAWLG